MDILTDQQGIESQVRDRILANEQHIAAPRRGRRIVVDECNEGGGFGDVSIRRLPARVVALVRAGARVREGTKTAHPGLVGRAPDPISHSRQIVRLEHKAGAVADIGIEGIGERGASEGGRQGQRQEGERMMGARAHAGLRSIPPRSHYR